MLVAALAAPALAEEGSFQNAASTVPPDAMVTTIRGAARLEIPPDISSSFVLVGESQKSAELADSGVRASLAALFSFALAAVHLARAGKRLLQR